MPVNQGTLIITPVRPNDSSDEYPVAYANEILGGYHSVETIAQRNSISHDRRLAGMLCTVYNDPVTSNNETYILGIDLVTWTIYKPAPTTTTPPPTTASSWLESQEGFIEEPEVTEYILVPKARYPVTIKGLYVSLGSGSLSLSLIINSSPINLPSSAILNVANTPIDISPLNSPMVLNDKLILSVTAVSSPINLVFQVDFLRA